MVEPNWGIIRSGPTFEALVSMLVFYKDPEARLFGRRGKDGGQDVRSGDGLIVYQAKFHFDENPSHAFNDAKSELKKILSYQTVGHVRYEQWLNVTHWRLVTNVMFNTTDEQRWTDEIVPLFAAEGLTAVYWTIPYLNGLLANYPEIQRMFFEVSTPADVADDPPCSRTQFLSTPPQLHSPPLLQRRLNHFPGERSLDHLSRPYNISPLSVPIEPSPQNSFETRIPLW